MPSLSSIASVLASSKGFAFSTPLRSVYDFEQPGYFSWAGQWFQVNRWQSRLLIVTPSAVDAPRTPSARQSRSLANHTSSYGVVVRKDEGAYKFQAVEKTADEWSSWHSVVITKKLRDMDLFFSESIIRECKGPYDDETKSSG